MTRRAQLVLGLMAGGAVVGATVLQARAVIGDHSADEIIAFLRVGVCEEQIAAHCSVDGKEAVFDSQIGRPIHPGLLR